MSEVGVIICGVLIMWFVLLAGFIKVWSWFADRRRRLEADSTPDPRSAAMWAELDEVTR